MVYRIISQKSLLQFFPKFQVPVWNRSVYQILLLSSLWHLRRGITEGQRVDATKRWAKCRDHFLSTASQEGNIPNTAQHYHLFIITCPDALCPILPPSSLWSAQCQLTHLKIQTLQSLNSRSLGTRGVGDAREWCMASGTEWGGWAEAVTPGKLPCNASATLP